MKQRIVLELNKELTAYSEELAKVCNFLDF